MKRTRILLLAVMVALIGLAARQEASAVPCYSCICIQNCERQQTLCIQGCDGNQSCDQRCGNAYIACIDGCNP